MKWQRREKQELLPNLNEEEVQNLWTASLLKRFEARRYDGCAYQGLIAEWHPTEALLIDTAKMLQRSYEEDMSAQLRKFLVAFTVTFHKIR